MTSFNQQGLNLMISEVKAMTPEERAPIIASILQDFRSTLYGNFDVPDQQKLIIDAVDDTIIREWAGGIALALDNPNWSLIVVHPGDPAPTASKCGETKQSVSGSASTSGGYTVSKTVSWTW